MKVNPYVFYPAGILIVLFVLCGAAFPEEMGAAFAAIQGFIVNTFGWFYIIAVTAFLLFVLYLLISPYGQIRLGKDDEEPEYSYLTWFAMLFSAGMGIGLLFFSVAEPITHFGNPPRSEPQTVEAAREAMTITFFHWGLHAWAIYIVVALALSYFAYRHDLPLAIRSTLYPILGKRVHGPIGHVVDILAVFGTLFGLATSLGLGVQQINAGLDYLGLLPVSMFNEMVLIAGITLCATVSVVTGVNVGIRRLSELNLGLALLLLVFVFVLGPTVLLLSAFIQNIGQYLSALPALTFRTDALIGTEWQRGWTMFYWGWWISWSPFVGMFIARVSRGRTIREFIVGVLLVPSLLTFGWLTVFGNTALDMALGGSVPIVEAVTESYPTAIFVMLDGLPLAAISSAVATLVVAIFFITSSDSGSLVVDILTAGGHPDPPIPQRVFWALMEGAVAATLLYFGGLVALQTAAITTALPFCVILLVICWSLLKGLRAERLTMDPITRGRAARLAQRGPGQGSLRPPSAPNAPALAGTLATHGSGHNGWREQLRQVIGQSERFFQRPVEGLDDARGELETFMQQTVLPAFEALRGELEAHGRRVEIDHDDRHAELTVYRADKEEFTYAIRGHVREKMVFAFPEFDQHRKPALTHAEVVLRSGQRRPAKIRTFTQQAIIDDFLRAYAKWMGW